MTDPDEPPEEETRLAPLRFGPLVRSSPRLVWEDAQGSRSVKVNGRMVVGSASGSGLVLHDPTVSRVHAELEPTENGLWVRDLGSRNGVFVDGLLVSGARVPDGSQMRFGSVAVTVHHDASATPVELWPESAFGGLVGPSLASREMFATLARLAPMDAPVLIHGETGTGKELVAHAIHDRSPRADKPFVVVDCAALPANLLEVELFGHARGAFTGAIGARAGAIEAAHGGTVFLDEVGELPLSMQPRLLRALELRSVRRVGENDYRTFDVRFISATHRDLLRMVGAGEFREDLFFRLSVLPVRVAPLRERRDDIEPLVNHFLAQAREPGMLDPHLVRELVGRPWRGNVRELRNFVDRARALGAKQALSFLLDGITPADGAPAAPPTAPTSDPGDVDFGASYRAFREAWIENGEKQYVSRLLERHGRNVAAAARAAGVDRTYLYRLIRRHEL